MSAEMQTMPEAYAKIKGSAAYPDIEGMVYFFGVHGGTFVSVEVRGLPGDSSFHGFHIHAGEECSGTPEEPFKNADGHYNPENTEHPNHAGDMPPLLSNRGIALSSFYTGRFYPEDIIGKTVILHAMPDDFKTQPSGDSGAMIACGKIAEI